jgi:hypothetical protein
MPTKMLKMRQQLTLISLACSCQCIAPALAQPQAQAQSQAQNQVQTSNQNLEQMLNSVDSSPFPAPVQQQNGGQLQSAPLNQGPSTNQGQSMIQGGASSDQFGSQQSMAPNQMTQNLQPVKQDALSPIQKALGWLTGSSSPPQKPGLGTTIRKMFADPSGYSQGNGSGNASRAEDQAGYAHNAYLRSFYGDHDSRNEAADQAYYAAEEARHEADAAYAKLQSGDPNAQSYADSARAYADSAQADADTARSNADSTWK